MNTDTAICAKIRALLAKAEATTHPEEAAAFLAKAQELMEKYQVELYDLGTEDPIGTTDGVIGQAGPPSYKSDVQICLAKYYGARAVRNFTKGGNSKVWVVDLCGPESARITTVLMTEYVWKQICTEANGVAKKMGIHRGAAIRHVAKALCLRIRIEINQRTTAPHRPGTSLSLTVVDAVNAFVESQYADLRIRQNRTRTIATAAVEAAAKISLRHQTGNGANTLRLE